MKRIISTAVAIVLVFSSIIITNAGFIPPSKTVKEQYDIESYYSDLWNNYERLFSLSPYRFLTEKRLFAYQGFVEELNKSGISKWAIEAAAGLTGESATVERNIEILVNLMILMEYDLNDVNNHQVEADTLKSFGDYAKDVVGMLLDSAGLSGITGRLEKVIKAAELTFSAVDDIVIANIDSYKLLNKMLLNFETYYNLLDTIIKYADDANLVEAAKALRNNVNRAMDYKLNHFNETTENTAKFLGKDVFLDNIVIEALKNPKNLNLNSVDEFCVNALSKGYKKLNDIWAGVNLSKDLGVFAADMLVGISDIMNRCVETKAMYLINNALIEEIEELRKDVHSIEDFDNIDRIYNSMRYMMYVDGRGDFCLYQLIQKDGKLLSLIFNDRENVARWWSQLQDNFKLFVIDLDLFYPDVENYLIVIPQHTEQNDTEVGTDTTNGTTAVSSQTVALSDKEKSFINQLSAWMSYSKFSFDSSTASSADVAKLMYINIIAESCWAYEYFWGNKGVVFIANDESQPPDPLNKFAGKSEGYYQYSAKNVDWIVKNIFNVSPSLSGDVAGRPKFYCNNGSYYFIIGYEQNELPDCEIEKTEMLGDENYLVTINCSLGSNVNTVKMTLKPKTIDSVRYLTVTKISILS